MIDLSTLKGDVVYHMSAVGIWRGKTSHYTTDVILMGEVLFRVELWKAAEGGWEPDICAPIETEYVQAVGDGKFMWMGEPFILIGDVIPTNQPGGRNSL